jgi:uncharacterized membrane protein YidH (DUF202 family)
MTKTLAFTVAGGGIALVTLLLVLTNLISDVLGGILFLIGMLLTGCGMMRFARGNAAMRRRDTAAPE